MPHNEQPEEDYETALMGIESIVSSARRAKRMNIIGIDANAIIGDRRLADDERIVGDYGHGHRNTRGDIFVSWLHGIRLSAVNTMHEME